MAPTPKPQNQEELTYDTQISYKELKYGKYVFVAKLLAVAVLLIAGVFLLLTRIGKSMKEDNARISNQDFLSLSEKNRSLYRAKVRNMLIDEVLKFREDTVLIEILDSKYQYQENKGVYKLPEERNIYGCRLEALEMVLKRSLLELQFPLVYTRVVPADSLKLFDLSKFRRMEGPFPLYIPRKIDSVYHVEIALDSLKREKRDIFLPDSIAAFFNQLYANGDADRLMDKYVGAGPTGPYKGYTLEQFAALTEEEKKEQRRAFLKLPESEQKRIRSVKVPISGTFFAPAIDEQPSSFFRSILQQKIHEVEISVILNPCFNHATFSLIYPMAHVYYVNFVEGANNMRLIALKSGRAPAQYYLERKDCPKALFQGMYADITEFLVNWDQLPNFPKSPMRSVTLLGRYYGVPRRGLDSDAIGYRRDWLEEPGIIEWFQKKGWIHPVDKRPYIPLSWTHDDFRTIAKLMTDNDPTGKRRGFAERPGPMLYLEAHSLFKSGGMGASFFKVNPTLKTTYLFWEEHPIWKQALKTVHDMYWVDKSIITGVDVNYNSMQQDFNGGRVGMYQTSSSGIITASLMAKYSTFGPKRPYSEIVGLTCLPGSPEIPSIDLADCSLLGFNPYLNQEQLHVAVDWIKEMYYGEFVGSNVNYQVRESRILGSESRVYRDALTTSYSMDYSQYNLDFKSIFPPNYLEYFENLRKTQSFPPGPAAEDFGLQSPPSRYVQDRVFIMFHEVLMNENPDYDRVIRECAHNVNTSSLNYVDTDAKTKLIKLHQASMEHYKQYIPDYYKPREAEFLEKLNFLNNLPD